MISLNKKSFLYHGRRQKRAGGWGEAPPWIFTHDTANVFFNKHSFCENIPTLTNHLIVICCAN